MPEVSAEDRLACIEASSSDSEPGPGDAGAAAVQSQREIINNRYYQQQTYQRAEVAVPVWILMEADEESRRHSALVELVGLATAGEVQVANLPRI